MMKGIGLLVFLVFPGSYLASNSYGQDARIVPTLPNTTIRDYSKPSTQKIAEDGSVVPTIPNTTIRDYSKPVRSTIYDY